MFLKLDNTKFLSQDEIKRSAPSVFTKTAFDSLSSKYTHIPTSQVIEDMAKLNFFVTECKEIKARKRVGFQKHLLIFRNPDLVINGEDGDVIHPQILISNSHDGSSSFIFHFTCLSNFSSGHVAEITTQYFLLYSVEYCK